MVCKQCGAQNADNVKFCSACGARMEDDKVACKSCGQMNAKDAVFCAFCGGRTDGQTVCSACGTVHEGKFCPSCGHAEGVAPAPQAAPAAPVYAAPAPQAAPAPVYAPAPVAAKAPMNTLQKILSIVGSAVLMLGVLFAIIGLFGIGVAPAFEGLAATDMEYVALKYPEKSGLFYYFSDYAYNAYGIPAEMISQVEAAGGLSAYIDAMQMMGAISGDYVAMVTTIQIFGIIISLTTLALVVSFAIPAIISFIKEMTGKANNFGKWAILTIVMFFMGSGMLYSLNVYAQEATAMGMTESVSYGFNGLTKTAIVLGCIGIGVFVATKLFATAKSWINVKGILRVSFAVVAVVAIAFVFTGAKEAAITIATSENEMGMSYSETQTISFFQMIGNDMFADYVIVTDTVTGDFMAMSEDSWNAMSSMGYPSNYQVDWVGDLIISFGMIAGMFSIVVAVLAAVALGKMIKNLWSEEKSGHLGISIVLLIFTAIYVVFAFVLKAQVDKIVEGIVRAENNGTLPMGAVLPEVSVTPVILAAVFAVINLGMAIAQKVVAPKPVAPNFYGGYGVPAYAAPQAPVAPQYGAPQGYNNNNMSFGG